MAGASLGNFSSSVILWDHHHTGDSPVVRRNVTMESKTVMWNCLQVTPYSIGPKDGDVSPGDESRENPLPVPSRAVAVFTSSAKKGQLPPSSRLERNQLPSWLL